MITIDRTTFENIYAVLSFSAQPFLQILLKSSVSASVSESKCRSRIVTLLFVKRWTKNEGATQPKMNAGFIICSDVSNSSPSRHSDRQPYRDGVV